MNFSHSDPLTVEQRELLVYLLEAATDVAKRVGRILQYGLINNADALHAAVGATLGVVDRLTATGVVSSVLLEAHAQAQLVKPGNRQLDKGDSKIVNY